MHLRTLVSTIFTIQPIEVTVTSHSCLLTSQLRPLSRQRADLLEKLSSSLSPSSKEQTDVFTSTTRTGLTSKSSYSASSTSSDISEFNDCREDSFREDGLYSDEHHGNISVHLRSEAVESEQLMKLKEELEKITNVI